MYLNSIHRSRSRKKWWQRWKSVVQINGQINVAQINAVCGKRMENVRHRIDVKLLSNKNTI